jgi:small conductance mechanosensitive channel
MVDLGVLATRLVAKLHGWLSACIVMLPNLAVAVVLVVVFTVGSRWIGRAARGVVHRISAHESIAALVGTAARAATIAVGVFLALGVLNLDKTLTSLLAGVGVVGLALGFAFQDIAANFMSGFLMALRRPFDIGDLVEIAGKRGKVARLELRETEINTLDGITVIVPNKEVFQNPIVNYTRTPRRRVDLKIGTAYGDDMEEVRRVVLASLQDVPARDPAEEPELYFEEFADSAITFSVRVWLTRSDEPTYLRARSEAMISIKRALDREKLTIPFPIRTLDFGAGVVGGERLDAMKLRVARDGTAETS